MLYYSKIITLRDGKEFVALVEPTLKRYDVGAAYVEDKKRPDDLMSDFRVDGKWYRGTDVDKLSMEEATRLAEKAVKFAREAKLINERESESIKSDVESYFKKDLVKVRTCAELEAADEQWHADVFHIYEKHVGKQRADKVRQMYDEWQVSEMEKDLTQ